MLAGGVAGALTVATQGLAVAVIGVSLFTVGVVAGQTVSGLILDRVGYGPAGVVAVTMPRIAGGALALLAVAVSLQGGVLERVPVWMLMLPIVAGIGIAWQQATNGRLRQRVGTPLTATLVNFLVGTAILVVAALISVAVERAAERVSGGAVALRRRGHRRRLHLPVGGARACTRAYCCWGSARSPVSSSRRSRSTSRGLRRPVPAGAVELVTVAVALASVAVAATPWRPRRQP